jgi:hypothetical protein
MAKAPMIGNSGKDGQDHCAERRCSRKDALSGLSPIFDQVGE